MKTLFLLLLMLVVECQFVYSQNSSIKSEKVLRLLNINRDEKLSVDELKERLRLGRILQHVYEGDTMVFNPKNAGAIKELPREYVEYTRAYFKLMNHLLKGLNPEQKKRMRGLWEGYDITTPVMLGFLQHDAKSFYLSVPKKEILNVGVTEKEYEKIVCMINEVNAIQAQADTIYWGKSMYREDVTSIFFPNDVIRGLDFDGSLYKRFKESFLAMIRVFKKQF